MSKKMKITILLIATINCVTALMAQDSGYCKRPLHNIQEGSSNLYKSIKQSTVLKENNSAVLSTTVAACDTTGYSGNAYGALSKGSRSLLYYDPNLNSLTYTHRSCPAHDFTPSTGYMMFDQSTDGGLTWVRHRGPVYSPNPNFGRFQQGWIYNPPSNTNPNNAFISCFGPCTNGPGWVGHWACAGSLSGIINPNQQFFSFIPGYQALIPFNADVQQDGTVWIPQM